MIVEVLKSKIHYVTVTGANLNYIGSVTIDEDLMDAANIIENEKVHVLNKNSGDRLETYVIKGQRGSGEIVIIMSYAAMDFEEAKSFRPRIIFPDTATNKLI
jgi:aspartate 1-decarboxylase